VLTSRYSKRERERNSRERLRGTINNIIGFICELRVVIEMMVI